MYKEVLANHLFKLVGCPQLVWQSLHTTYVIFKVANILRAIHVVPNFSKVGHFFLNKYKFWYEIHNFWLSICFCIHTIVELSNIETIKHCKGKGSTIIDKPLSRHCFKTNFQPQYYNHVQNLHWTCSIWMNIVTYFNCNNIEIFFIDITYLVIVFYIYNAFTMADCE